MTHRSYYVTEHVSERAVREEAEDHLTRGDVSHLHFHERARACSDKCETLMPPLPRQRPAAMDMGWLSLPGAW